MNPSLRAFRYNCLPHRLLNWIGRKTMNLKFRIVNTAIMSVLLSFMMTMFITFINLGWSDDFFMNFLHAWKIAWPAAFVAVLIIGQPVQQFTKRILAPK